MLLISILVFSRGDGEAVSPLQGAAWEWLGPLSSTRAYFSSKVIFCGDITQVDNPYISPFGGMAALIEKFKGSHLFGHVTLERSVRSPLAEMAATVL